MLQRTRPFYFPGNISSFLLALFTDSHFFESPPAVFSPAGPARFSAHALPRRRVLIAVRLCLERNGLRRNRDRVARLCAGVQSPPRDGSRQSRSCPIRTMLPHSEGWL